jgi:hypothetical protein
VHAIGTDYQACLRLNSVSSTLTQYHSGGAPFAHGDSFDPRALTHLRAATTGVVDERGI